MTKKTMAAALVLGLWGLTGCAGREQQVKAAEPMAKKLASPDDIRGPFVQAGQQFSVVLDQEINTRTAYEGQPFTAKVAAPIHGWAGRLVVPAGAELEGQVVEVGREPPSLTLHFSSIKVGNRRLLVDAKIVTTEAESYRSREVAFYPPRGQGASVIYFPSEPRPGTRTPHEGQMDLQGFYGAMTLHDLKLEKGSTMRLELTRPLLGIGSFYLYYTE